MVNIGEEQRAAMAVAGAMVGRERRRQHPSSGNFATGDPGSLDWRTKADKRHLRRVDNAEYSLDAPLPETR